MKRLARTTVLALFAVVALSGCIRYNVDMTLSEDDTASGTIVIAVQKGVGEQMGVANDQEALAQLFGESPFGANFTPKEYAEGDWVGQSYTFDAVPIADLTDLASLFTVTRDGDVFSVDGSGAPVTADEQSQLPPGAESKLSITFPGDVIEHNGTLEGKTVTWDLFTMTDPVHATAGATASGSGSSFPLWLLIGGGTALVALMGAAVVVILMRRRRGTSAPGNPAPVNPEPFDDSTPPGPSDAASIAPVAIDTPAPPAPPAPSATTPPPPPPAPPVPLTPAVAPKKPAATRKPAAAPTTPAPTTPAPTKPATTAPKARAPRVAKPKVDPTADGDVTE